MPVPAAPPTACPLCGGGEVARHCRLPRFDVYRCGHCTLRFRHPLPDAQESSTRVVRQYLAAYGPASREDVVQFTGFGPRGFYWLCDKACGFRERTR